MKTIPPPCPEPETGPQYWRSLDQLADKPEFRRWLENEFPAGASEFADSVSRRNFVKIMSASFLFAGFGLTGCRRPVEHILPFSKMPENYVHGLAQYYATAMPNRGSAIPLLVRSDDGRPTKIEGNPEHPISNGSTDQFAQASILNLYDPDRATRFARKGAAVTRPAAIDFLNEVAKQFAASQGEGLCLLMERSSSPSRDRLQTVLSEKLPKAKWFVYEPTDFDVQRQAASLVHDDSRTAQAPTVTPRLAPDYQLDQASVMLALDCDFLGTEEDSYINIRRFANGRRIKGPGDSMNRLYAVEGVFSLTGANADHRLRVPTSQVLAVAAGIAAEVVARSGIGPAQAAALLSALKPLGQGAGVDSKWITECANDL
ncbi:MAG: TAT-variant-translocated molybdopterin oxidoreductase, partial [Pedosphaera parvula]|nr:TAT-variant-translocated molybdopterin oxidoreductase [Pedosphaera parvula]